MTGAALHHAPRGVGDAGHRGDPFRSPTLVVASPFVAIVLAWAVAPGLFTAVRPGRRRPGRQVPARRAPRTWFGTDHLGRDLYARVVYGTPSSVAQRAGRGRDRRRRRRR